MIVLGVADCESAKQPKPRRVVSLPIQAADSQATRRGLFWMEAVVFHERDKCLKLLGFESYSDYLSSDLWQFVRGSLKESRECCVCKSTTGLAWHHRSYEANVLVGNFSGDLIVRLCNDCHKAIHQRDGHWFDMDIVEVRFVLLRVAFLRGGRNREEALLHFVPTMTQDF